MSLLGAKIQAGFEPIPGYVLTKKLGSGGYGDVWSADAPGGLKKAIKFVFGTIHEDRASAELKSLQRIRQVNHPFILSLERIEIVEGQLLIVTELAQGSMFDRYLQFRERGFAGIAHDRLLAYLKDAADGLDFLCQKHELQHLDVKPGNLLLVSDRIKVADFGLVKDLHSMSQSLLGGLTPTYAAPEMFDGRPGRYSDQYSLAIVYQEMLTGTLPFRGRTTAQLANEHLNKAPNLESLPVAERPIIAKALAKRPQQRFADCREMVSALEMAMSTAREESAESVRVRGWSAKLNPAKPWAARINSVQPSASPLLGGKQRRESTKPHDARKVQVSPYNETSCRSIVIGLGGMGIDVIAEMRKRYEAQGIGKGDQPIYFVMDTDAFALRNISDPSNSWSLPRNNVLHAPLKSPHYYRDGSLHFPQLSRRWLYNIPRSQLTEGVRPLGMLAFIDHAAHAFDMLGGLIEELIHEKDKSKPFEARIVASAMGGTGSAAMCEVGFLLRQIAETLEIDIKSELVLTCAAPAATALGDLASASAISSLLEINHYFKTDGLHPELPRIPQTHSHRPPFDQVKLTYGGQCGIGTDRYDSVNQVAEYLLLPAPIPSWRDNQNKAENSPQCATDNSNWLSTIRVAPFPLEVRVQPAKASTTVFLRNLLLWISVLENAIESRLGANQLFSSPKVVERIEYLVTDTFRICNWNAQAWVRDVMRSIIPDEKSTLQAFRSRLQPSACSLEYLQDLKLVCEPLGVDLSESSISIQQLFECRFEKLLELLSAWMTSAANWPMFPKLLELLEERLKINSHSLLSVAKKLEERYSRITDAGQHPGSDETQTVSTELGKVEVEATFHRLSGKMLLKFVDRLTKLKSDWLECSVSLHSSFKEFGESTSQQKLGCSLESFALQNPQSKVDSMNRITGSQLSELVLRRWIDRCNLRELIPLKDEIRTGEENFKLANTLDPNVVQRNLESILECVLNEFKKHSTEIDGPPSTSSSNGSSSNGASRNQETNRIGDGSSALSRPLITKTILRRDLAQSNIQSGQTVGLQALHVDEKSAELDPFDFESKIEGVIPYLSEFGDSIRLFLYTSEMVWYQLPEKMQAEIEKNCQIFLAPEKMSTYLVSEGNDLDLEELIDKVWMPTNETWQLVPRVISRVDIEWVPFSGSPQAEH